MEEREPYTSIHMCRQWADVYMWKILERVFSTRKREKEAIGSSNIFSSNTYLSGLSVCNMREVSQPSRCFLFRGVRITTVVDFSLSRKIDFALSLCVHPRRPRITASQSNVSVSDGAFNRSFFFSLGKTTDISLDDTK